MKRRQSRELAFKLLYARELSGNEASSVLDSFASVNSDTTKAKKAKLESWDYAVQIFNWTIDASKELDIQLSKLISNWSLDRLSKVDKVLIYMACSEIQNQGAPYEVVIDEVLEISKSYGDKSSYSFINGVIDSWRKSR
jgi:transcription antitermination protein NusB